MAVNIGAGVGTSGIPNIPFANALQPMTIAPAQAFMIPPGNFLLQPGQGYAALEQYDPINAVWKPSIYPQSGWFELDSDGTNYRIINRTGCPTGAIITNNGSSYTSAPTVTASAGGSVWLAVVGGSINTSVTVTTAGAYNYIPTLVFSQPPAGGVRAAGYVSALGAVGISTVVVTNEGAGYTTAPTITIVQDPRDTATGGGVLTVNATLTNVQRITALQCIDPGTAAQTSTPTLTFSGGGGGGLAATVLMNYTVTGFTVTNKGSSLGNSANFLLESMNPFTTAVSTGSITDPILDAQITNSRMARLLGYTNASGNIIASNTSVTIIDAGFGFQQVPSLIVLPDYNATTGTTGFVTTTVAATVGGTNDTWFFQRGGT